MYSTLSRCLRLTPSECWTTYWQRRISATYRMVFTRRSTRIPSRTFGSGSTPINARWRIKGQVGALQQIRFETEMHRQKLTMHFHGQDKRAAFTPDSVTLQTE